MNHGLIWVSILALIAGMSTGCETTSHTENDAVCGGIFGGLMGAIIGHAAHNTAGAAYGRRAALAGAAIGSSQDQAEARNAPSSRRNSAGGWPLAR